MVELTEAMEVFMTYQALTTDALQEKIDVLANPKNCGVLLLINQLIKKSKTEGKKKRVRTCKLAEKLLSNLQNTPIVVSQATSEFQGQFVNECIAMASQITASPTTHHGIIRTFASNLLKYLHEVEASSAEMPLKLIRAWKDFSSHWLRDEIHHVLMVEDLSS